MDLGGFDGEQPAAKKAEKPNVCPLCHKKGHKTKKSKQCKCDPKHLHCDPNRPVPVAIATTAAAAKQPGDAPSLTLQAERTFLDAADAEDMHSMPSQADVPLNLFDEKEDIIPTAEHGSSSDEDNAIETGSL